MAIDDDIAPVELVQQHGCDHQHFDDGRHELQDDHADDGLDGVAAALQDPGQSAGLALQMEAQGQQVHVLEGEHRQPPHRMHRDLGEQRVANLGDAGHQDAHAAIGRGHHDRRRNHDGEPGGAGAVRLMGERIGRPFVGEGHRDGGELGGQEQAKRHQHALFEIGAVARPDIGPKLKSVRHSAPPSAEISRFTAWGDRRCSITSQA